MTGERRLAFNTHADAPFDVCFENQLNSKSMHAIAGMHRTLLTSIESVSNPTRHVELDIDIGADAKDWSAIQASEQLKPVETELRRIEEMVQEIVSEMDYLRGREQKLRDTNESTNERVKWFAFGTMGMLVGLGVWQVIYLRAYFRFVLMLAVYYYNADEVPQVEALDLEGNECIILEYAALLSQSGPARIVFIL